MNLQLTIITPIKSVFDEEVEEITLPSEQGELTILPNHISLFTRIKPGQLSIRKNNKPTHFAITGGFLEVKENKATILADYAIRADDIEILKAQEAKDKAEKIMKEKVSGRDFAQAEAQFTRAILELKVAKRRKSTLS